MKVLRISRGTLELARVHLNRPYATIGRSPACDVVLRAAGVAPIHFLMEWVGTGNFDPSKGNWSIFDISENASASADSSGEGVLLGEAPVRFKDLQFTWAEDRLETKPEIGGQINAALSAASLQPKEPSGWKPSLVELVQVRTDSGAIEDVVHIEPGKFRKPRSPLVRFPRFKISLGSKEVPSALQILLEEMPDAKVLNRGVEVPKGQSQELTAGDLLDIRWKDHRFYLRFVEKTEIPAVKRGKRDPLLFKLSLGGGLSTLAILLITVGILLRQSPDQPKEPPRVATVEVQESVPPAPEKVPPPVIPPKPEPVKAGLKMEAPKAQTKTAAAAAPKFHSQNHPIKKSIGLNSPARVTDINQIGLLGALKGTGPKGPGVKAEMIMNEGLITQSVSNKNDANAKIVLKNPPPGGIGSGTYGSRHGNSNLAAASTSLESSGALEEASGPIAVEGGKPGFSEGSSIGGKGKGVGSGSSFGNLDLGSPQISGGLDRETVRRIIMKYRGQIRTCYERALLSEPHLSGRVTYDWTISPRGPVASAKMAASTAHSPSLESCVLGVIRSMRFPAAKNGQPTIVIYPFVFQAKS